MINMLSVLYTCKSNLSCHMSPTFYSNRHENNIIFSGGVPMLYKDSVTLHDEFSIDALQIK